jgi:hypothetical protein
MSIPNSYSWKLRMEEQRQRMVVVGRWSRETTYHYVASLELEWLRLSALCAEPFAVDKGTVGALHIFNVDLERR